MKIVLFGEVCLKEGLSYEQACKACQLANQTKAAEYLVFTIVGKAGKKTWDLMGRPKELARALINDPDAFVIEINDE